MSLLSVSYSQGLSQLLQNSLLSVMKRKTRTRKVLFLCLTRQEDFQPWKNMAKIFWNVSLELAYHILFFAGLLFLTLQVMKFQL